MTDRVERVRVLLPNGAPIWAEVEALGSKEAEVAGFDRMKEVLALDSLRHAIEGVGSLVLAAIDKCKPDKASVEFGLELGVDSGQLTALWVKGTGKANLKVTLSWDKPNSDG